MSHCKQWDSRCWELAFHSLQEFCTKHVLCFSVFWVCFAGPSEPCQKKQVKQSQTLLLFGYKYCIHAIPSFSLLLLTSSFSAVTITTDTRGHRPTTNINMGHIKPLWVSTYVAISVWWGLVHILSCQELERIAVVSQLVEKAALPGANVRDWLF